MSHRADKVDFSFFADWFAGDERGGLIVAEAVRGDYEILIGELATELFARDLPPLYSMDCANVFDPHFISDAARRRGLNSLAVMKRAHVTRAHTIYQTQAAVVGMLKPLLGKSPRPFVAVWALDHLFFEETLQRSERELVLREVLGGFLKLAGSGLRIFLTVEPPVPEHRWIHDMVSGLKCALITHEKIKMEHADMGRNSETFNGFLHNLEEEWRCYEHALSLPEQREALTDVFTRVRVLVAPATAQAAPVRMDAFYMSVLVSLAQDVKALKRENADLRDEMQRMRAS